MDILQAHIIFIMRDMTYAKLWDFRMDTGDEKDLCLFSEWA